MERAFNACQKHRSTYPSVFNRFPVIQPVSLSSKVHHFSTFFAHFGLSWVRPWDNRGKCYMDGKRIQCWSTHSSIYPSIFNRLRAIARYWSEIATFSYPLHFTPPLGCSHWNSEKSLVLRKLESWGYQAVKTVWRYVELFRHNTSVWRTDRQTYSLYQ